MSEYALEISNLHKTFKLPVEKAGKLKTAVVNIAKGIRGYKEQKVLRGITFKVKKGEFFGIVGRNGSGKSTLLKIISQIYQPTKGGVKVRGKLVPFIELGVGFNPELTGRENIYLNGALLGFSNQEIDELFDEIVEFAELGEFMDQKLKNYSSGMQVRLAFSIAIKSQGDILVLDEVLAVGDEAFQRKCNDYFDQIKKDKTKTVILVTHSMENVRKYCDRALMINNGRIIVDGSPEDVANEYTETNFASESKNEQEVENDGYPIGLSERIPYFKVLPVSKQVLTRDDDLVFAVEYKITDDLPVSTHFAIIAESHGNAQLLHNGAEPVSGKGKHRLEYVFPLTLFNNCNILVVANINEGKKPKQIAFTSEKNSCRFAVRNKSGNNGLLSITTKTHGHWKNLSEFTYDTTK